MAKKFLGKITIGKIIQDKRTLERLPRGMSVTIFLLTGKIRLNTTKPNNIDCEFARKAGFSTKERFFEAIFLPGR